MQEKLTVDVRISGSTSIINSIDYKWEVVLSIPSGRESGWSLPIPWAYTHRWPSSSSLSWRSWRHSAASWCAALLPNETDSLKPEVRSAVSSDGSDGSDETKTPCNKFTMRYNICRLSFCPCLAISYRTLVSITFQDSIKMMPKLLPLRLVITRACEKDDKYIQDPITNSYNWNFIDWI